MPKAARDSGNPYQQYITARELRLRDWDTNFADGDYQSVKGDNWYDWDDYNPWDDISFQPYPIIPDGAGLEVVAKQVLDKFELSYDEATLDNCLPYPVGVLPGCDIRNQQASQVLHLSCAEGLKNEDFVEIYMDGDGVARFRKIGSTDPGSFDIRYSIPTGTFKFPLDMIIVTGWDPPAYRWVGDRWKNYLLNAEVIPLPDLEDINCLELTLRQTAFISYDKPLIHSQWNDIIRSEYELTTWDRFIGNLYMIKWDGGHPHSSFTFSESTRSWINITNIGFQVLRYYPDYSTTQWIDGINGCWLQQEGLPDDGSGISIGPFSHYEAQWDEYISDLDTISRVIFSGNRVWTYLYTSWLGRERLSLFAYVETEAHTLGKDQYALWEDVDGEGFRSYRLVFKQYYENSYAADWQDHIEAVPNKYFKYYDQNHRYVGESGSSIGIYVADFAGSKPGWMLKDVWVEITRKRPSVTVISNQPPPFDAPTLAESLVIKYLPIITTDPPAPQAVVTNTDVPYPMNKILDQLSCSPDTDPRTVQDYLTSECYQLDENRMGNVQEFTFPFLDAEETLDVANTLFDVLIEEEDIQAVNYTCGPDSEPVLGGSYPIGTRNIINSIDFSYQDSSSYHVSVQTGPGGIKSSFGNSLFQLQTEEYSAPGVIQKSAGNGWLFLVDVYGFGLIPAVNLTMGEFEIGDNVNVTIHNNPVFSWGGAY